MSALVPAVDPLPGHGIPRPDEVLQQLARIRSSRPLRESSQLQSFLDFIVRETLDGRSEGLKEYTLGCTVFGRKPDYEPRRDGIVRVQATTLRKRLERYYAEEGVNDPVRIELPRGGYVPSYRYRDPDPDAPVPAAEIDSPPLPQQPSLTAGRARHGWPAFASGALFAFAIAAAVWLVVPRPVPAYRMVAASPGDFPQLWSSFFTPGTRTLVGFGVPLFYSFHGLYVRDVKVNSPGQERDGRILDLAREFGMAPTATDNTYTGLGEAVGTNLLSSFLSTHGIPVKVANAHAIGQTELKDQNLVVVSSLRFQTLVRDLNLPSDFEFLPVSPEVIHNRRPLQGEQQDYVFESGAGVSTSYAIISLWPGLSPDRRILFIGGVHTWATQAATEFILNPERLKALSAAFSRDRQTGEHGPASPFFQILLKVEGRGDLSQRVEYITHHYVRKRS